MENASKALLMAGSILIALLIIASAVYLIDKAKQPSDAYYKRISAQEVEKYNTEITKNFIIENGETYITAQGIITLKNILNTETYKESNINSNISNIMGNKSDAEFLTTKGTINKKYEVEIEYSAQGMINDIKITNRTN